MWYTCPCCDGCGYLVGNLILDVPHPHFEAVKCTACGGTGKQFVWVNFPQFTTPTPWLQPTWVLPNTIPCGTTSNVA